MSKIQSVFVLLLWYTHVFHQIDKIFGFLGFFVVFSGRQVVEAADGSIVVFIVLGILDQDSFYPPFPYGFGTVLLFNGYRTKDLAVIRIRSFRFVVVEA